MTMMPQISNMTSLSNDIIGVVLFPLSSLVTGPSFMSISSLVLELWQFSFIRDWPEIRKSEIPPFKFCLISGDWGKLGITNFARMYLIKNPATCQGYSFHRFWVIKGNPTVGEGGFRKITPLPPPSLKC